MENIDKNADILTILDGYKSYAVEYEERKKKQEEEEKMKKAEEEKKMLESSKKKSIQDEIAETLCKIKEQEAADAARFEEERQRRDEKKRKEEEMKAKIQEQLEKMQKWEREQSAHVKRQQEIREREKREREIKEKEEQIKIEISENKRLAEKKKLEDIERKKMLAEIQAKKAQQAKKDAKRLAEQTEKRKEMEALEKKKRIEEGEKLRQRAVEEEKKRLWAEERERERKLLEGERMARLEEDRRVSGEIMARRQSEEDEMIRLKKEAEEYRLQEIERTKKAILEEKKRNILSTFEKKETEKKRETERPKRNSVANPFAAKFEEIAMNAQKEEQEQLELLKKKKKKVRKSRDLFRQSKQLLNRVSKESLRKSQNMLKKLSNDSLKKTSTENLNRSFKQLRKSLSRDGINKSKQELYDKDKNLSSQNLNLRSHQNQNENHPVNRQKMQNYLISQVLFDGKEDVRTSRMHMAHKPSVIIEEVDTEKEEENKRKEREMIRREMEMKKQIKEELNRIKALEEEERIKQQERQFESYKKEMEKYLDFVCEDNVESTGKKVKKKKKAVPEPSKKLTLNIGNIKNQFESEKISPAVRSAPPQVQKLNPIKMFAEQKDDEPPPRKKKEYVPVIIDKAAFERTVGMFEKEKREEEEKKQNELRIKKRRKEMEAERQRLIEEKEQKEREETERLEQERREQEQEEERKRLEEEANALCVEENEGVEAEASPPIPEKVDIFEQIKRELDKIKEEDEKMKGKIEKDRKKKELMKQIQDQIDQIKTVDNTLKKPDDPQDDTPAWIKMILGSKDKEKQGKSEKDAKPKSKAKEHAEIDEETEMCEGDSEAPKWIKIFQERSDKLKAQKEKAKHDVPIKHIVKKTTNDVVSEKELNVSEDTRKSLKKSHTFANIDITTNEALVQKSVSSVKLQFEQAKNEEKVEVKKRTGTQKVTDRVRRVKSLLLEGGSSQEEKKEKSEKKITKSKANKIKTLFEPKSLMAEEAPEAPKRPKKKLVKLPGEEKKEPAQNKPIDRVWKWKQKDVSELYDFIDSNKKHIPASLRQKAEKSFAKETENKHESSKNTNFAMEDDEFEDYIETIHKYVEQKDTDETESCFKDTIVAYLDLIDENPRKMVKAQKPSKPKKSFYVNTAAMRDLIEGNNQAEANVANKDVLVRKIDTSFLFKESEDIKINEKPMMSQDNIRSMKMKYEVLGADAGPKELYSMKRKLIPVKPDVDSLSLKKKQVEHQWKYKQKGIEELQQFIKQNREKANTVKQINKETKEYVPYFRNIDYKSRIEDEDKKMEEFESFMDEIHDFLESETLDDEESSFKWGIHSYIDLIEENKGEVSLKYERRDPKAFPENMPKMNEIKAKLMSSKSIKKDDESSNIGKIDASSYLINNEENLNKITKVTPNVSEDITRRKKSLFEVMDGTETEWEKTVVKRKLIDLPQDDEEPQVVRKAIAQDWKYKQKSLVQLQDFINKNKDIAPEELIRANSKVKQSEEEIDSSQILTKSNQMRNNIVDKEKEFDDFLQELDDFMEGSSKTEEEETIKDGIKSYLDLIEPGQRRNEGALPEIGSARKIKDIKSKLSFSDNASNTKKDNSKLIGKVSHFFKKSTNEKCDSTAIKENIASLLQPGKAKILSKSFESKPKLTRSSSVVEIPRSKLPKKMNFEPFQKDEKDIAASVPKAIKQYVNTCTKKENKTQVPNLSEVNQVKKSSYVPKKYKSEWEDITDPEEKRNAILAKHGLKPMKKIKDDDDSDIEDILNYENKDEMSRYEKDLKQRYLLLDSDSSSKESSPEPEKNKKGSFSSLLNILTMMKKTTASKNYADSKAKAMELGKEKSSRLSRSEVDLSEINGSCTDVRKLFDSGKAFDTTDRRRSLIMEDEEMKSVNAAEKRAQWENFFNKPSNKQFKSSREDIGKTESVTNIKDLFEQGRLSQEAIRKYIDQRSETSSVEDKNKMYDKVKYMFESGNVPKNRHSDDEDEEGGNSIQSELDALRQSAKQNSRFKIEKGKTNLQSSRQESGLRRANSCIGVSGERLPDDLDEETMAEVSVTNKMVKAMFEQNAPKYKFGGSGSNLSLNSSKENVNKKGPVTRPSVKPKEERKWVLDSINKFFDVIVEEEENSEEDYSVDNSDYSESEYESDEDENCDENDIDEEEEEQTKIPNDQAKDFHSTSKMRGLLSSVVSNISGSVVNLASREIISNLKQNLGSQINLRTSNSNLSKI